jgi:hypothetical protein
MRSERRKFVRWLGGASVTGAGLTLTPRAAVAGEPTKHPRPVSDKWDVGWAERVEAATYRAVFDSPELSDGGALFRAVAWADHYKEIYGVDRKDMAAVLVIRHAAITLAMNDDFWRRFEIGKQNKMRTPQGKKWRQTNPIGAQPAPDSASSGGAGGSRGKYTLQSFIANGGIVLACGWAFGGVVSRFREADKLDQKDADTRAREHLIPGVILQPNGIFGVLRAQEAGCQYVMAS